MRFRPSMSKALLVKEHVEKVLVDDIDDDIPKDIVM